MEITQTVHDRTDPKTRQLLKQDGVHEVTLFLENTPATANSKLAKNVRLSQDAMGEFTRRLQSVGFEITDKLPDSNSKAQAELHLELGAVFLRGPSVELCKAIELSGVQVAFCKTTNGKDVSGRR